LRRSRNLIVWDIGAKERNERRETHVKERIRKAAAAMRQMWGISKRRFGTGGEGYGCSID